ncbi:MAG: PEP-CTERM sorting domain-containing protein [Bryobacterales bacterium]|nr:PEP-CTERM sorting domain-containing protein [Bryobacterales bacterium]
MGLVQSNNIVAMTITSPGPAFNAITLNFDLWIFNTWDGDGWTYPVNNEFFSADQFQVAVGGSTPTGSSCVGSNLCTTFAQAQDGLTQSWPQPDPTNPNIGPNQPGRTGDIASRGASTVDYFSTAGFGVGYTGSGYDIYRINLGTINLGSSVTSVTVYFRGLFSGDLQQGWDESWGLGRVQYSATSPDVDGEIPEPSTIALGGLGLALLALAKMRNRKKA